MKPGECSLLGKLIFLAGLFWLAVTAAGFAGGEEKRWLGGDDPLFGRDVYYDNGYALRAITPIKDLPERIVFKPGEISLIADPTDCYGKYMVVYLVNDTDQPIQKIIGELNDVSSQAKFGRYWFNREETKLRCGTVPEPTDLPPRQALALGAVRNDLGDTIGEIRYLFSIPDKTICSEPMRGRYDLKNLFTIRKLTQYEGSLGIAIHDGLCRNDWSRSPVARTPEELCALLELVRHHDLALSERSALFDWIVLRVAKRDATPEQLKVIDELGDTLKRPWMIAGDIQPLVDRSIKALEQDGFGVEGSPEKCHVVVWRYLAKFRSPQTDSDGKTLDERSQKQLVALALKALESTDTALGDAAADFLSGFFCDPKFIPKEAYAGMLQHGSENRNFSGLQALASRERSNEAGAWVLAKVRDNHPRSMDFYEIIRPRNGGVTEDWEKHIITILLKRNPLDAVATFSVYCRSNPALEIPEDNRDLFRAFLRRELTKGRCSWWRDFSKKDWDDRTEGERTYLQGIRYAVQILDSWNDPQDNDLLYAFLGHPAASKSSDGLEYEARTAARNALKRRGLPIPTDLITREKIKKP